MGRVGVIVLVLVAAVSVALLIACSRDGAGAPAPEAETGAVDLPPGIVEIPEAAQKNVGLQTLTATSSVLPATIDGTGVVAPDERRVSHVRPLARGVIEDIPVTLGARVRQGQTLVTYDNIELGELVGDYLSEVAAQRQAEADREVT